MPGVVQTDRASLDAYEVLVSPLLRRPQGARGGS